MLSDFDHTEEDTRDLKNPSYDSAVCMNLWRVP